MSIVQEIIKQISATKHQYKFLCCVLNLFYSIQGKATYSNMARYCDYNLKTFARNYARSFNFAAVNKKIADRLIYNGGKVIAAIDCSFLSKSGKATYGVSYFHNGCAGTTECGKETSLIALINVETREACALESRQTPGKDELALEMGKESTRMDWYAEQVATTDFPDGVHHIVADGAYANKKFVDAAVEKGLAITSKLRKDANLYLYYEGEQKKRGRKRILGPKIKTDTVGQFCFVTEAEDNVEVHTVIAYSPSLKRKIRVVLLRKREANGSYSVPVLLFSTDVERNAMSIWEYYKTRYQIEFLFRDAKQHCGLHHCQSRKKGSQDFHHNAVFMAVNAGRLELKLRYGADPPKGIGLETLKREFQHQNYLDVIFSKLELDAELLKNTPVYQELLSYGSLAA